MRTNESGARRRIAQALAVAALVIASTGALLGSGSASAAAPGDGETQTPSAASAPQLRISIDNGRTQVAAGETLTYATTVTNLGASPVQELIVTQTIADGLEFVSADENGAAEGGLVTWTVSVAPSEAVTVHTTMAVQPTPDELLRLASVACARTAPDAAPIVCATHSDQLPAGAAAESTAASSADDRDAPWAWLIAGGIGALLLAAIATALALRRRARRSSGPGHRREQP